MLPSLRPLIAESMRAMATAPPLIPGFLGPDRDRLWAGAATLEWCDANDTDVYNEADERIAELESAMNDVRAALTAWDTSEGKKRHQDLKQNLAEILAGVGL